MSNPPLDEPLETTVNRPSDRSVLSGLCKNCEVITQSFDRVCGRCDSIDFQALLWNSSIRHTRGNVQYLKMTHPHSEHQHLSRFIENFPFIWSETDREESPACSLCGAAKYLSELVRTLETRSTNKIIVSFEKSYLGWLTKKQLPPLVRVNLVPWNSDMSRRWWNFDFVPISTQTFGCARKIDPRKCRTDLMSRWIKVCASTHGSDCNHPSFQTHTRSRNIRVVDVDRMCLVEAAFDCTYFALSYVWGKGKQNRLSIELLAKWQVPGALEQVNIPRTIKDAILLTRSLKFQYLWVDSLCIVQDSIEDRTQQIQQMFRIYDQAFLTIIVASGDNCEAGIPGLQPDRPRTPVQSLLHLNGTEYGSIFDQVPRTLDVSTWNQRGWTFQEIFCSRRTLIFTDYMAAFSCPAAAWREDWCLEPDDAEVPRSTHGPVVLDISRRLVGYPPISRPPINELSKIVLKADYDTLGSIVHEYLRRYLTDENDILNAFEGIAQKLMPVFGPFLFGLPEGTLCQGILWTDSECTERRVDFPSWSWAGWHTGYRGLMDMKTGFRFHSAVSNFKRLLAIFPLRTGAHPLYPEHHHLDYRFYNGSKFDPQVELLSVTEHAMAHKLDTGNVSQLIAFKSSTVTVRLAPSPNSPEKHQSYDIFLSQPPLETAVGQTSRVLQVSFFGNILVDIAMQYDLIVLGGDEKSFHGGESFFVTLIQWHCSVAYRVAPTILFVDGESWWSWNPEVKIVVLG